MRIKWFIDVSKNIISSSSNDIGYTKLIEMDIETDINLPPIAFKPYTLALKHKKWVKKS